MTGLTYVLSAPALKVLRRRLGRGWYWAFVTVLSGTLVVAHATPLGILFFSMGTLIGVFEEFEDMEFSLVASSFFTLLINTLLGAGAFAFWVSVTGPKWMQILVAAADESLSVFGTLPPLLQTNAHDVVTLAPSSVIMTWMVSIYIAVLLEGRLSTGDWAVVPKAPSLRPQLVRLRMPDAVVWIFIAAIVGRFVNLAGMPAALSVISANVIRICGLLFFFQGVAVVYRFVERLRLSAFWQGLFLFVAVVQVLFVSLIGLLDYWMDFRTRMTKRAQDFNRKDA